jgi:hypothetical protein
MKRLFLVIMILIALLSPTISMGAAGDCVQTRSESKSYTDGSQFGSIRTIIFTCTGDSSNGTFPAEEFTSSSLNFIKGFYLYKVITNPGSAAPTDNWDFTITDSDGVDLMGGNGANRHTTTSQSVYPLIGSQPFAQPYLGDTLTLNLSGNSVVSATLVLKAIFVR